MGSQVALGLQSDSQGDPSSFPALLRRASCRDDRICEAPAALLRRGGSLKTKSSSVMHVAGNTSHVTKERDDKSSSKTSQAKKQLSTLQADKSLFLSFDNIKGALFGDSKVSSTQRTGESVSIRSLTELNASEKDKSKVEISMQKLDKTNKPKSPVKDEFTEFSQNGSRFHPTQMEEKSKKSNLVDQFSGHRIVQKVAKSCQKHSKVRKSTAVPAQANESLLPEVVECREQPENDKKIDAPIVRPRNKKEKQN